MLVYSRNSSGNRTEYCEMCTSTVLLQQIIKMKNWLATTSKEYVKRLWNTLKTTFLNVKLQRLIMQRLQCITSSKDLEKQEKYLCVRDKAEDICWMPVVFWLSDDTTSLIGMILSLTFLNGPRNTSRNHSR